MPILATGKYQRKESGFTLLELLLVVVILAVLVTAGVVLTSVNSQATLNKQQGQLFVKELSLLCEKALFENQNLAVEFSQQGRQQLIYNGIDWQPLSSEDFQASQGLDLLWRISLQGMEQPLTETYNQSPHIICYSNGQFSAFDIKISASEKDSEAVYHVASIGPSQMTQGWLND